ncbi:MAG: hypothetical protein K2X94_00215 [Amoebophilaceae bacterium]|nr:hypothetical protein [Amoebophilaceae bacterium]
MIESTKDCLINTSADFKEHHVEWNASNCHALAAAAVMHQCGFVNESVEEVFTDVKCHPFNHFTDNFKDANKGDRAIYDETIIQKKINDAYDKQDKKEVILICTSTHAYAAVVGKKQCYVFNCSLWQEPTTRYWSFNSFVWEKMETTDFCEQLKGAGAGLYFFTVDC